MRKKLFILVRDWQFYLKRFFRKLDNKLTLFIFNLITKSFKYNKVAKVSTFQNILCFITENIGDTIRASGVINFINKNFKSHFVCTEYNKEVLKLCGVREDHLIISNRDPGFLDFIKIARKIKQQKWDTAIILDYTNAKTFSINVAKILGISEIVYKDFTDHDYERLRVLSDNSKTDILTAAKFFIINDYLKIPIKKEINITNDEERYSYYRDFIGVHVGGFGSILYPVSRKYPEVYTFQLIETLLKEGHKVLITGDNFDRKSFHNYSKKLSKYKNFLDLTGKLFLFELACLLKNLKIYITPDNGTLHLAQSVGCKNIIALLGPTSPLLVQGWHTKILRVDLPYSPCLTFLKFPDKCINTYNHECIWKLKPEMLEMEVKRILTSDGCEKYEDPSSYL